MGTTYAKGRIYKLDIASLKPDADQPRKYIDPGSLAELTASIAKHGVLEPILFRQDDQGNTVTVAGERRVSAARAAGLTVIPGVMVHGNHREIALVENLLRENLTPVEEAEALNQLKIDCSYTQTQLSDMIGKTQASISQSLSLTNLPEDVRNACRSNTNIPKTILLDIAKVKTERGMQQKFQRYMARMAKTGPQAARPARPSRERALIRKMDDLVAETETLTWDQWSEDDRQDLINALRGIYRRALDLLNAMNAPLDAREPEDESAKKFF